MRGSMLQLQCIAVLLSITVARYTTALLTSIISDNLHSVVSNHSFVVVHFYSEGCIRCNEITTTLESASTLIRASGLDVSITQCDVAAAESNDLVTAFNVRGSPTVKLLHQTGIAAGSQLITRELNVTSTDSLIEQIRLIHSTTVDGTLSLEITSIQQLKHLQQEHTVLLGMFPNKDKESEEFAEFSAAAKQMHGAGAIFAHSFEEAVAQMMQPAGCCSDQALVLSGPDGVQRVCPHMHEEGLMQCLSEAESSSLIVLNGSVYANQKLQQLLTDQATLLFAVLPQEQLELPSVQMNLESLAADLHPVRLVLVEATRHRKFLRNWNLTAVQLPAVILYGTDSMMTSIGTNLEVDGIRDWLTQQQAEEVPAMQGRPCTAMEAALKADAPFLLHAYLPWCTISRNSYQLLAQLGTEMQGRELKGGMKVVDLDASNYTLPYNLQVATYPALFFIRPAGCEAVKFTSELELEALQAFWQTQMNAQSGANYVDGAIVENLPSSCTAASLVVVDA